MEVDVFLSWIQVLSLFPWNMAVHYGKGPWGVFMSGNPYIGQFSKCDLPASGSPVVFPGPLSPPSPQGWPDVLVSVDAGQESGSPTFGTLGQAGRTSRLSAAVLTDVLSCRPRGRQVSAGVSLLKGRVCHLGQRPSEGRLCNKSRQTSKGLWVQYGSGELSTEPWALHAVGWDSPRCSLQLCCGQKSCAPQAPQESQEGLVFGVPDSLLRVRACLWGCVCF